MARIDAQAAAMLGLLVATVLFATADGGVSPPADNLVCLARAWEQVRLFHPWLYEREVNWDQAWVTYAPRAEAAPTPEALRVVIAEMLATLGDPMTRVRASRPRGQARPGPLFEVRDGIPIINVWSQAFAAFSEAPSETVAALKAALAGQPRVVFDLRGTVDLFAAAEDLRLPGLGPSKDAPVPSLRIVVHHGYSGAPGGSTSGYSTAFEQALPTVIRKASPSLRRYAFVIDPDDRLSPLALAMQRAGEAFVVSTAPTDDRVAVGAMDVDLGHGLEATVRSSTLLPPRGFAVDLVVPSGKPALDAAVALIKGNAAVKPAPSLRGGEPRNVVDAAYAQSPYPSRELRQLAAVRVWMVARRFWAYPALTDENYDAVLASFLPRLAAAGDAEEYVLTLAEMSTHLPDGHTRLSSPTLFRRLGETGVGIQLRVIEKQLVVWKVLPEVAKAGIQRGDVLLRLDGQSVAAREAFLSKYITASSPEALRASLAWSVLMGDEGSRVRLQLAKADGSTKEVELTRSREGLEALFEAPPGPHVRVFPGNIGYIDLVQLETHEVDAALKAVEGTRALIIDIRGYPKGAAFVLGPLLDVKHPRGVAQFFEPLVTASPDAVGQTRFFLQTLPPQAARYTQPTVALIDDQAESQSEHSGLIFEAYAGTTFIGSPTAGANGDVATAMLPGEVRFRFSGHDVRHADGRQLQRIGLVPDVLVRPTIAGLRAGKDEVLDAALAYLKRKLGAP